MPDIIYCYPDSNVLRNKFNIKDNQELFDVERRITSKRISEIIKTPVKGEFDFKHLKDIHKALFSDIYAWAGKERIVDISKSNLFSLYIYIDENAEEIFNKLEREKFLIGTTKARAIERLAYYMGDINALHPFREGNGRTQVRFIDYLARATGFKLNFDKTNHESMLEASIYSMSRGNSKFERIFSDIAEPLSLEEQRKFLLSTSKKALQIFDTQRLNLPDRTIENKDNGISKF